MVGLLKFFEDKDCNGVKALIRDPLHNVAKAMFDDAADKETVDKDDVLDEYYGGSYIAITVSVLSLLVWATFWPVWGSLFDGDGDDGLRLALSICALTLCCMYVDVFFFQRK